MLRPSAYNIFVPEEGGFLLANLVTEALVRLDNEHAGLVRRMLKEPNKAYFGEETRTLEVLKSNGILIDSDFDEQAYLKLRFFVARYGNEALGLSILSLGFVSISTMLLLLLLGNSSIFLSRSKRRSSSASTRSLPPLVQLIVGLSVFL